ncbi:hypothetical protein Bca101_059497 [Brassica carinata]
MTILPSPATLLTICRHCVVCQNGSILPLDNKLACAFSEKPNSLSSPILKEEIIKNELVVITESESEDETPDEKATPKEDNVLRADKALQATKYCLNLSHTKSINTEYQVPVKSIIDDPYKEWSSEADIDWVDETNDMAVCSRICLSRWLQGSYYSCSPRSRRAVGS